MRAVDQGGRPPAGELTLWSGAPPIGASVIATAIRIVRTLVIALTAAERVRPLAADLRTELILVTALLALLRVITGLSELAALLLVLFRVCGEDAPCEEGGNDPARRQAYSASRPRIKLFAIHVSRPFCAPTS